MKKVKSLVLVLLLSLTLLSPRSEAAVGIIAQDNAIVILGVFMTLGGPSYLCEGVKNGDIGKAVVGLLGLLVTPPGAIVLDQDSATPVKFNTLDLASSTALDVSNADRLVFNSEVEEINSIAEEIYAGIQSVGPDLNREQLIDMSRKMWQDGLFSLSKGTQETLQKMLSKREI